MTPRPGITIQSVDNQVPQGAAGVVRDHRRPGAECRPDGEPHLERYGGEQRHRDATDVGDLGRRSDADDRRGADPVQQPGGAGADDRALGRLRDRLLGRLAELGPDDDHEHQRARRCRSPAARPSSPGGSATLTVTANQAPLQNTQVELDVSGSASPGTDYDPVNPVLTLDAGHDVGERDHRHAQRQRHRAEQVHRRVPGALADLLQRRARRDPP